MSEINIRKRYYEYSKLRRRNGKGTVHGVLLVLAVTAVLIVAAYAPKEKTFCGKRGHLHTAQCIEKKTTPKRDEKAALSGEESGCDEEKYVCGLEEHTHSLMCYSDPEADKENQRDWERMIDSIELSSDRAQNIVLVAQSQLGYTASRENYAVIGERKMGYTRYGDWYGSPYGDWCAMFVSFCIRFAGIDDFPIEASCSRWVEKLSEENEGLFRDLSYEPKAGDIVFFDYNKYGLPEPVGIITAVKNGKLFTVEGNCENEVRAKEYSSDSDFFFGYGEIVS